MSISSPAMDPPTPPQTHTQNTAEPRKRSLKTFAADCDDPVLGPLAKRLCRRSDDANRLTIQLAVAQERQSAAEERLATASAAASELQVTKAALQDQQVVIIALEDEVAWLRSEAEEHKSESAARAADLASAVADLARHSDFVAELGEDARWRAQEVHNHRQLTATSEGEAVALQIENAELKRASVAAAAEAEQLRRELASSRSALARAVKTAEEKSARVVALETQASADCEKTKQLAIENQKLVAAKHQLATNNHLLIEENRRGKVEMERLRVKCVTRCEEQGAQLQALTRELEAVRGSVASARIGDGASESGLSSAASIPDDAAVPELERFGPPPVPTEKWQPIDPGRAAILVRRSQAGRAAWRAASGEGKYLVLASVNAEA